METLLTFFNWLIAILYNGGSLMSWLLTPMDFGFIKIMPLALLGIDGLMVFVVVAIAKWIIA